MKRMKLAIRSGFKIKRIVKILVILLSWLTISPLLLLFLKRKLRQMWIWLLILISPLFIVIYIILVVFGIIAYTEYDRRILSVTEDRIEMITGISSFPAFSVDEYIEGKSSFNDDYKDRFVLQFKDVPDNSFYEQLDTLDGWIKDGYTYSFSVIWGNGIGHIPEGEKEESDGFFEIEITKGKKEFYISNGTW